MADYDPIFELRIEFGDTDEYNWIFTDEEYQFFLDKYENPKTLRKHLANSILAKFAINGMRQKVGQEEIYGSERYKNYLDWIKQKASNPLLSGNAPALYIGGTVREKVAELECRTDLMDSMFYQGQHARRPYWNNKRYAGAKNTVEIEEEGVIGHTTSDDGAM